MTGEVSLHATSGVCPPRLTCVRPCGVDACRSAEGPVQGGGKAGARRRGTPRESLKEKLSRLPPYPCKLHRPAKFVNCLQDGRERNGAGVHLPPCAASSRMPRKRIGGLHVDLRNREPCAHGVPELVATFKGTLRQPYGVPVAPEPLSEHVAGARLASMESGE